MATQALPPNPDKVSAKSSKLMSSIRKLRRHPQREHETKSANHFEGTTTTGQRRSFDLAPPSSTHRGRQLSHAGFLGDSPMIHLTHLSPTILHRHRSRNHSASPQDAPPAYVLTPPVSVPAAPRFKNHSPLPSPDYTPSNVSTISSRPPSINSESPYAFLTTFDTTLLIDDSGSMAGRSWNEVSQALMTIAPIVTEHDSDGIDVYFLNHKSADPGLPLEGVASGGYRNITSASRISEIFDRVRPGGGTPTGLRVHAILKPYLTKLEAEMAAGREMKPLNLIVLTDGVPSDDVESVLITAAKKLDRLDAPPYQIGVQFFQVGNEQGATESLMELDDELGTLVEGGIRDIVDTVTWTGRSDHQDSVGLTGDGILKVVLGAVVRRLDRRAVKSGT